MNHEIHIETPPWECEDLRPEKPANAGDYGYLKGDVATSCSREELLKLCSSQHILYAWTPKTPSLVPPETIVELHESIGRRAEKDFRENRASSLGLSVVFGANLISNPEDWPLFTVLLVFAGVFPLVEGARQRKNMIRMPDAEQCQHLLEITRYANWIRGRSQRVTLFMGLSLVLVFIVQLISGMNHSVEAAGLVKEQVWAGEVWRIWTAPLLHGNFLHLLFNLGALYSAGVYIEAFAGGPVLGVLFLLSATAGSLASLAMLDADSVGASGGILGLFGFLVCIGYRYRYIFPEPLLKPMVWTFVYIGIAGIVAHSYIDNAAHAGGAIAGMVIGLWLVRGKRRVPLPVSRGLTLSGWTSLMFLSVAVSLVLLLLIHQS